MTAAKLPWKDIWLMCLIAVHPFSLNNWQGPETPYWGHIWHAKSSSDWWIFSSSQTCSWLCNFRQRYNHGSFDFNWHGVRIVRCQSRSGWLPSFSQGTWDKAQKEGKIQSPLLGFLWFLRAPRFSLVFLRLVPHVYLISSNLTSHSDFAWLLWILEISVLLENYLIKSTLLNPCSLLVEINWYSFYGEQYDVSSKN